ncbi:MAG: phosphotransferase family protein [Alphaproteobacteria bacterium]|nr:phosphotransferase family protein [Alphaproteobacteria bacterium]
MPAEALARFLSGHWGEPVSIAGLKRFHGGSARQTYRFDATGASGRREALVLRRDPPSSLIETDRWREYRAIQGFAGSAVPVPEPLFCDAGPGSFESPGFLMREVAGGQAAGLLDPQAYGEHGAAVGQQFFTALGHIHAADPASAGLAAPAGHPALARLAHWQAAFAADQFRPEPVLDAAMAWLAANPPPPPPRISIVHGDYRSGNFLHDGAGRLLAILDWEMVHAGDAHEDLAWACDPLWSHFSGLAGGMLPLAAAVAAWEAASGLALNPQAWAWWRIMAQVQGLVIWISAAREIIDGRSHDPVLMFAGTIPYRFHSLTLARALEGL